MNIQIHRHTQASPSQATFIQTPRQRAHGTFGPYQGFQDLEPSHFIRRRDEEASQANDDGSNDERGETEGDSRLAEKKWLSWAPTATSSPFPSFPPPTPADCEETYHVLNHRHCAPVENAQEVQL